MIMREKLILLIPPFIDLMVITLEKYFKLKTKQCSKRIITDLVKNFDSLVCEEFSGLNSLQELIWNKIFIKREMKIY